MKRTKRGWQLAVGVGVLGLAIGLGACRRRPAQGVAAPTDQPLAGTEVAAGAGCAQDSDCKGARVCQEGACVSAVDEELADELADGGISILALQEMTKAKHCVEAPGVPDAMKLLSKPLTDEDIGALAKRIGGEDLDLKQSEIFGEWLLAAHRYQKLCKAPLKPRRLAKAAENLAASVHEDTVDKAIEKTDCATLTTIHRSGMWPFKYRMSLEIVKRDFSGAEETRMLWMDTLKTVKKECKKRLNRRQRIAVSAQLEKLQGIIGLDDSLLVNLRAKLLTAMETADAGAIATLSKAISEREAVLDKRKSRDMDAELKKLEIRRRIAEKRQAMAEAKAKAATASAAARPPAGGTAPAGGSSGGKSDAEKVADGVKTGKAALDVAGAIFGF